MLICNWFNFHSYRNEKDVVRISYKYKHSMSWERYHSLSDMYSYFDYLEKTYNFVSTETIGKTFEKRDMRVVRVCKSGCGKKKSIWIDGGIHAR